MYRFFLYNLTYIEYYVPLLVFLVVYDSGCKSWFYIIFWGHVHVFVHDLGVKGVHILFLFYCINIIFNV